jgi:Arc/MetJ-type ribon-helix-helix transcriptional regulator
MPSKVSHVRLPEAEYKFIDEAIENGYFTSKTDFIKSAIRLQIHETSKRILADLKKKRRKKISHAELLRLAKKSRKAVYKEIWS